MDAITINQLFQACREEIRKGNGDRQILISADDEGNSYHYMFFTFSHFKGKDIDYGIPMSAKEFDKNFIILG